MQGGQALRDKLLMSGPDLNLGRLCYLKRNVSVFRNFLAFQAVAVSAKFISCGAITHHENIQAFNRLIEIENELQASGKLKTADSHAFPVYREAEVPEDTAIGGEEVKKIQSDMKEAS